MSIVEQTIARLRKQQVAAMPQSQTGSVPPVAAARNPSPGPASPLPSPTTSIVIDPAALRAAGYQPEPDRARQFADQFRHIKRPLIDKATSGNTAVGEPRVVLVTSAFQGDGKTFTSVNLALSMALERDLSVLLVDVDAAKRRVSEIFGLQNQPGLMDLLENETLDPERVVVGTSMAGLSILPAGRQTAGAVELLSSNRMRKIISALCARNARRILLLDAPPLLVTTEGRTLARLAGQVVLVVRAGTTPRHAVEAALKLFDAQQAGGVILNHLDAGPSESYYYTYAPYGTAGDGP